MSRLRVAFVIMDVGPVGGMERQATEIIRGLVDDGHEVTVVARTCDLPGISGVRFHRVPTPRRPYSLSFPLWVAWASAVLWRLDADVVHVNGGIVLNRADIATVHFCHRAYQHQFPLRERTRRGLGFRVNGAVVAAMTRALEAWCLRPGGARQVVAISAGVGREIERWFPARARPPQVIPYGVDSDRFRPSSAERTSVRRRLRLGEEDLLAVFVGGDWERKGLGLVIEALGAAGPNWQLVVAGEGDRDHYEALAARHAPGRVSFAGRTDPAPLYAAGDAFVFPTAYETFSLVTHEAAAAGLPLLVTPVSGPDELVTPGRNGWFVTRTATDIAGRLRELAADAPLRAGMGAAARASALPLTWERARAAHAELYASLPRR